MPASGGGRLLQAAGGHFRDGCGRCGRRARHERFRAGRVAVDRTALYDRGQAHPESDAVCVSGHRSESLGIGQGGDGGGGRSAAAFGAGVLVSFWALAALLVLLRQAGSSRLGFQLRLRLVSLMALLFVVIGLNLAGCSRSGWH
jgi:hypothetical protein